MSSWLAMTLVMVGAISMAMSSEARATQTDGLRAIDGKWIFVEDRTEGRALEQLGPPMASKFSMRVDEGVVVLNGHGSGHRDVCIALDGAMLAVSRSVNTRGKMFAFEYLRVVERDGGLVYVAQPGGKTSTEFVLTELGSNRAVFENPRHDYPKRIVYELSAEGSLISAIGQAKGGTPQRFEFKREAN